MGLVEQILLRGKLTSDTPFDNIPLDLENDRFKVALVASESTTHAIFGLGSGDKTYILRPISIRLKDKRHLIPDFIKSIIIGPDHNAKAAKVCPGWDKFLSKGHMMKSGLANFKLENKRYVSRMDGVECRLKVIPSGSSSMIKFTAVTIVDKSKVRIEDIPYISNDDLNEDVVCRSFKPNFIATTINNS